MIEDFEKAPKVLRDHFSAMTTAERKDVIRDAHQQMNYIALSTTRAGQEKRDELQNRIEYVRWLELKLTGEHI